MEQLSATVSIDKIVKKHFKKFIDIRCLHLDKETYLKVILQRSQVTAPSATGMHWRRRERKGDRGSTPEVTSQAFLNLKRRRNSRPTRRTNICLKTLRRCSGNRQAQKVVCLCLFVRGGAAGGIWWIEADL